MSRSLWPMPYTSAVSMKLTPQSMALCSAASDSESSTDPQELPMAHAPKLISETFQGVRASDRYFISCVLTMGSNLQRGGAEQRRRSREKRASRFPQVLHEQA